MANEEGGERSEARFSGWWESTNEERKSRSPRHQTHQRNEENEMYGWTEYEVGRMYREEIRQEVAALRLEKTLRAKGEGRFRLMGDTKWELERYAGLLRKRLGKAA
jgi:hypothetical protein